MIDSCNLNIKDKGYHLLLAHALLKFALFCFNLKLFFARVILLALIPLRYAEMNSLRGN